MSPRPVVALEAVSEDVQLAYDYFEARLRGAGERFLEGYFAVADNVAAHPEMFPVKFDDYRRALIPKCHYALYYFVWEDRSVIAAVIDTRREPRLTRDMIRGRRDNV